MTDIKTLKALAEAAGPQDREIQESDYGDEHWFGGDGCGQIQVGVWVGGGCKKSQGEWQQLKADAKFIAAANPAAVLELISEIDRLNSLLTSVVDQHAPLTDLEGVPGWSRVVELREVVGERDQLKADNEALRNLSTELRGAAYCHNLHHCRAEFHEPGELCKVLERIDSVMSKQAQS